MLLLKIFIKAYLLYNLTCIKIYFYFLPYRLRPPNAPATLVNPLLNGPNWFPRAVTTLVAAFAYFFKLDQKPLDSNLYSD